MDTLQRTKTRPPTANHAGGLSTILRGMTSYYNFVQSHGDISMPRKLTLDPVFLLNWTYVTGLERIVSLHSLLRPAQPSTAAHPPPLPLHFVLVQVWEDLIMKDERSIDQGIYTN